MALFQIFLKANQKPLAKVKVFIGLKVVLQIHLDSTLLEKL